MIELPAKFKQALGNGVRTSLYPIVKIYNGIRINDPIEDATSVVNVSIKETNIGGEAFKPLLLNSPTLTTSADIVNNKYTISSLTLSISNAPYNGKIFSDDVQGYLKSVVQVYYASNGLDQLEDCLLIYSGTIRRFRQTKNTVQLELEDYTEQVLSAKVPSTLIPEDVIQYSEKDMGKPYPMIYGHIDASPLIFNKLDRLEIDKPAQVLGGYWNGGSNIDFNNPAVDVGHFLVDFNYLFKNAYLSVYDKQHMFIFQKGVNGWGSRNYPQLQDTEFYHFQNASDISANIKINRNAYIYEQYRPTEGEPEGFGDVGIPARVYRPLTSASFFSFTNHYYEDENFSITGKRWGYNHFVGFSNNPDITNNIVESQQGFETTGDGNTSSFLNDAYETDWAPGNEPT